MEKTTYSKKEKAHDDVCVAESTEQSGYETTQEHNVSKPASVENTFCLRSVNGLSPSCHCVPFLGMWPAPDYCTTRSVRLSMVLDAIVGKVVSDSPRGARQIFIRRPCSRSRRRFCRPCSRETRGEPPGMPARSICSRAYQYSRHRGWTSGCNRRSRLAPSRQR
jgi:hypothetical protein